jgi:exodeoxyribonuclease V gamma subunit
MLQVYRSSRIETLSELLAAQLQRFRPSSVLTPQTLIVGHLGMKRWLTQQLAEQHLGGLPRIAANLDMLLPSEWLDRLAQSVLGTEAIAIAPYRRASLRWRIYQLLPQLQSPEVARYLEGEERARRQFQLADRVAGLYGQYLVYRRDWLLDWERAQTGVVGSHWQGQLWRRLVAEIGLSHRGQRMAELGRRLGQLTADPEQPALHVFGISHLPPDALNALDQLAQRREVCIYFPDPCRELWEDLRSRREFYQGQLEGPAFLNIGHPLLATLGRMGQHFTLLLNSLDAGSDDRDQADLALQRSPPAQTPLLQRLQASVRALRPEWARLNDPDEAMQDVSLRVHACHTRLRELEVLKDALLDQMARNPDLNPRQIVVMAPNMALYAPLLPVVFGEPGRAEGSLPYYLADVALVRSHPLLGAFRELLDLPTQRVSRSQVLALLALPAVARRFDLDAGAHQALTRWLERCQVAWGLDGPMKTDFGAAPVAANSFAFGLDRMYAGFLVGREDPDWLLDDRILPADPVHGPDAHCLGALDGLLQLLDSWRRRCRQELPLGQWVTLLQGWVEDLFVADADDTQESDALRAISKLIAAVERDIKDAGVDPQIDWAVFRDLLKTGLDGIPERQAFLAGGITFCGMVPQRAIPFRVIALLGLNDGDYPRPRPDTGLDLMQRHPRLGDRDNRMDDRYLFLEALMSARTALHLSYLGEGPQDGKPRNPALPLAELLSFLDEVHGLDRSNAPGDRPWRVRHPLQPFDRRYFEAAGDPRLYSYSTEFAAVRRDPGDGSWRFLAGAPALMGDTAGAIELSAVSRFFAKPSEWLCRRALSLSRGALEQAASEDLEALTPDPERFDRNGIDLLWQTLQRGGAQLPQQAPPRMQYSGQYAAGAVGVLAYQQLRARTQPLLDAAGALPPFGGRATPASARVIDLRIAGQHLIGTVERVFELPTESWLVEIVNGKLISFQQLLPLYLQWAALSLMNPARPCHCALLYRPDDKKPAQRHDLAQFGGDAQQWQAGLATLLDCYRQAELTSGRYFPRTSFAYAEALRSQPDGAEYALQEATKAWSGSYAGVGERDYAPGYNAMLSADDDFLDPYSAAHADFAALARRLMAVIAPASNHGDPA